MLILDTCAVLELFRGDESSFSHSLQSRLRRERSAILSISFAEIACKIRIGKLEIDRSVHKLYRDIAEKTPVEIMDIGVPEWLRAIDLDWDHKDPADRLILSYAIHRRAKVVSTDRQMKKRYEGVVW